ncbi:MAG: N-acetylmuramoyl-L-alanine amidase [Pseudomonadota bacterium]
MKKPAPGIKRIIFHWTGGAGRASGLDRTHYHRMVEFDGTIVEGKEEIEDNVVTSDDDYAAHTLHLNTGSIGIAVCGMMGAIESPFDAGPAPITEKAFRALARLGAELCLTYGIPVSDTTTLTHAEVEPNLGVKQRGKWDIARLPFREDLRGAKACGDYLRTLIREAMADHGAMPLMDGKRGVNDRPDLRRGSRGAMVFDAQTMLKLAGYPVGRIDGIFGREMDKAVRALQADNPPLAVDGVIGDETWPILQAPAAPPPRENITAADLRKRGSGTTKRADAQETAAQIGLGGLSIDLANKGVAIARESRDVLDWGATFVRENWILLIPAAALVGAIIWARWFRAERVRKAVTRQDVSL